MRRTSARMALGDPAEREERRRHPGLGEDIEQPLGVALDPRAADAPNRRATIDVGEGLDLEVILDIDGHRIAATHARRGARRRPAR